MRFQVISLVLLLALVPAAVGQESPSGAADEVRKLQNEFLIKQNELLTKNRNSYATRFLEIAEKNASDPAAYDALIWIVGFAPAAPEAGQAVRLLTNHVASEKIGSDLLTRVRSVRAKGVEEFLRAVAEKNPKHETKGHAKLALAQHLKQGQPAARKEAEKLLEEVIEKYGDVKAARGTLADTARTELTELRSAIVVGKEIPEIDGEDMDGKKFKISEYRGRVVMLDFWGHW